MPIPKKKISQTKEIRIEEVAIDSIKLWDKNPRINDQAVDPLAKILEKHGQRSPVVVRVEDNMSDKGNTTWKALKQLNHKTILVQWESFPSDASATAYGIADNKASEFSDWDDELLANLLTAEEMAVVSNDTGFSEEELRGLEMVPDIDKIEKIKKTDTGIVATIKIICKPEDRDEMRVLLADWAQDSGFEEVVVK